MHPDEAKRYLYENRHAIGALLERRSRRLPVLVVILGLFCVTTSWALLSGHVRPDAAADEPAAASAPGLPRDVQTVRTALMRLEELMLVREDGFRDEVWCAEVVRVLDALPLGGVEVDLGRAEVDFVLIAVREAHVASLASFAERHLESPRERTARLARRCLDELRGRAVRVGDPSRGCRHED